MDWLFNGINDFFQWCFKGMLALKMPGGTSLMNTILIVSAALLTLWWMYKMVGHARQDKR